mmetsp:Transcript_91049/g.175271  ORF Transcript_91049/g.175271 Transcript_91049/m.175271 type:complete len:459 (-) Transcript_91049:70-1446(-)
MQAQKRPSDPWAAGLDPWAVSAALSSTKASAPQPQPQDSWQPYLKGESSGVSKNYGGMIAGSKGARTGVFTKPCGAKGAGSHGRGRGGRGGPPILQNQKVRDWHVDLAPEPPRADLVDEDTKPSKGRGRSLITPAWKAATGLTDTVCDQLGKPPPDLQHVQSNLPLCDGEEILSKRPESTCGRYRREWSNKLSCGMAGIEVEVLRGFAGLGPGDWLTCQAGELLLVIYTRDDFAYAMAYGDPERHAGWLPVSYLRLAQSDEHYEFLVRLGMQATGAARQLGLVWAKSTGQLPGLVVLDVKAGSLLETWNIRCRGTFPRDQVLAGDYITWVDGTSEPENMNAHLLELKRQATGGVPPLPIRMRVLRFSTLQALTATGSFSLPEILKLRSQRVPQAENNHTEVPQPHTCADDPWTSGADPWCFQQAPNTSQDSLTAVDSNVSQVLNTRPAEQRTPASLWQ